jgi:hypothetical protein
MIDLCLALMIAQKSVSALKMGMGYFGKMSKELGRQDGRVCQEYGGARTFVVEHVGRCPSCR